jgi:hypothetical protein
MLTREYILLTVFFLLIFSAYHGKKIGKQWKFSILPIFFTLSSVALLYLVSLFFEQQIFIIISSLMYYFSLLSAYRLNKYEGDQTAKGMNMAAGAATIFFTYAGAYGLYLNFLVPLYYLILTYLAVTLLVSYQYFFLINKTKIIWIYSFILALVMAELIWSMNFWPFGYLTTGVSALILYYVLWDIIQSYFLSILNKKRVVTNVILFALMIGLVLVTSKWIPVI